MPSSDTWVNANDTNPGQIFYRADALNRFEIKPAGGLFYVTGSERVDGTSGVTLASDFATEDAARAWVLDLISPTIN
jgi:hypothetical protein